MLKKINIENVLFLDIETVPIFQTFEEQSPEIQALWDKKSKYFRKEEQTAADVYQRAGIYAEFGKIICISVGLPFINKASKLGLRIKSFYGDDEKQLLQNFNAMLDKFDTSDEKLLCGHNAKEFDFPYIARRSLINGVRLPKLLNLAGKKPWQVKHLDTMELWRFGDYKNYTSLNLLTTVFNIPTPKDDIDGSQVAKVYWQDADIERIVKYCQKDVVAVVQLFQRYRNQDLIPEEAIVIV